MFRRLIESNAHKGTAAGVVVLPRGSHASRYFLQTISDLSMASNPGSLVVVAEGLLGCPPHTLPGGLNVRRSG